MDYGRVSYPLQSQDSTSMIWTYIAEDEPWNGHGASQLNSQQFGSMQALAFQRYRNNDPSDYGTNPAPTLASDSGYASQRRPIPGDDSLCGESTLDPEVQVIESGFDQFGLISAPVPRFPDLQSQSTPQHSVSGWACPECASSFKNKTTLKKHIQRHRRSFPCPEPGCSSKDFGSRHDLARHRRTVHKQTSVPGKSYMCSLGHCQERKKSWPRADNFRSHLKNVHGMPAEKITNSFLDGFLIPLPSQSQDILRAVGSLGLDPVESKASAIGGGDEQDGLQAELETLREEPELPPSSAASRQRHVADIYRKIKAVDLDSQAPTALPGPGARDFALPTEIYHTVTGFENSLAHTMPGVQTHASIKSQPIFCANRSDGTYTNANTPLTALAQKRAVGDNPQVRQDSVHDHTTQPGCQIDTPVAFSIDSPRGLADADALDNTEAQDGFLHNPSPKPPALQSDQEIFQILEGIPEHILQSYMEHKLRNTSMDADEIRDDPGSVAMQKHEHGCSECDKSFLRKCELNKHMKRHEKPYGCTFPECTKKFGSKSDWRRHESSQHFQLEMWSCDQCPKAYHRREIFKSHLEMDHGLIDDEELTNKLETCRVDRHSSKKFWCGFCEKIILADMEPGLWNERYEHIEDHFIGRKGFSRRHISEWKRGDGELSKAREKASQGTGDLHGYSAPCKREPQSEVAMESLRGPRQLERKRQRSNAESTRPSASEQKKRRFAV